MKGLADFARESNKVEETKLKQEEVKLKRDMLKKGLGIEDSASGPRALVGRTLGTVQMRAIDWLWTGWIPKGYVTLLAGETGRDHAVHKACQAGYIRRLTTIFFQVRRNAGHTVNFRKNVRQFQFQGQTEQRHTHRGHQPVGQRGERQFAHKIFKLIVLCAHA